MTIFNHKVRLDHLEGVNLDADMQFVPDMIAAGVAQATGQRMDAGESLVFAQQLQYMRNQILMRPYPQYKAKNLLPMQAESPAGAEEFAYVIADRTGMFELISNYSDDLPITDVKGEKKVVDMASFGGAVEYSYLDQQRAAMAGNQLQPRKAMANRDAAEQKFDKIAWLGDAESGLLGISNHPNITVVTAPNGAAASPLWENKTAQEIYDDLAYPFVQQASDTNGIESPDTLVLSAARLERARNAFFGDNTGDNALSRFKESYPNVTIETVEWMAQAGAGSTQAMIAYRKDPMKIAVETPMPYTVMPPQQRNLATVVNAMMRTAGTIVYFPLSVTKVQGI